MQFHQIFDKLRKTVKLEYWTGSTRNEFDVKYAKWNDKCNFPIEKCLELTSKNEKKSKFFKSSKSFCPF